jgi:putative Mn2+ efflux pump MntP
MSGFEVILTGIALAMDACAVSMTNGMTAKKLKPSQALMIALFFGVFQALMPLIGYFIANLVASNFMEVFETASSVIAFVLLAFLGGKMIVDAVKEMTSKCPCECEEGCIGEKISYGKLTVQAVATSIDALAVGVTLSMLQLTEKGLAWGVFGSVGAIGLVTFALCIGAVFLGKAIGNKLADKAGLVGGLVLVAIGVKLLVEGLI